MSLRHFLIALALATACKTTPSTPGPEPTPRSSGSSAEAAGQVNAPTRSTGPKPAPRPPQRQNPDELRGSPAITVLPPGFATLPKATRIVIRDEWNGLGPTHDIHARLVRKGTHFDVKAKVGSYPGGLGESLPDPTSPRMTWDQRCVCDVDTTCPCESGTVKVETSRVPAHAVEAFLSMVARYAIDSEQAWHTGAIWTDDYPKGHVVVWVPGEPKPIHLSFLDQQRHWRVGGAFLAPDPDAPADAERKGKLHAKLNGAYARMCNAIGFDGWKAKAGPGGRR